MENTGTMPAWYSSLPESVKEWESTREAAIDSYERTATQDDWFTFSSSSATATTTATTTSSSSSDTNTTSVSTGGAPAVKLTGDVFMGLAAAAGILGLAIAL